MNFNDRSQAVKRYAVIVYTMALPTPSLFSFFPGEYIKCFAWYLAYHEGLWQHQCTTKAIIFQIWRKCNWKWEGCQRIARCRETKWRSDERAIWQEVEEKQAVRKHRLKQNGKFQTKQLQLLISINWLHFGI